MSAGWRGAVLGVALVAALVPALPALGFDGGGSWVSQPPASGARQEVSFVQVGGKLYLAGGGAELPGGRSSQQVFDPVSGAWSEVAPLPAHLDHIQGVALGGKIFYVGGLDHWPSPQVGTVWVYDPKTDSFSEGASMGTRARGAGGVAVHDGRIYYAGGLRDGDAVKWFDVYDPATGKWTALPDMPTARDHFHAVVLDGRLWAIGGRAKAIDATTAVNEAFSFATGAWSGAFESLPTQRGGFAAAAVGDEVLIIGGEGKNPATGKLVTYGTVEAYNVKTDAWRELAPMPTKRHGIQAAVCNGGIYIAAGGTLAGSGPTAVHEAFHPGGIATPCVPDAEPAPPPPPGADRPGPGPDGLAADGVRPRIGALRVDSRARRLRVRMTLSEPATVRIVLQRATRGRRVGKRCRRATRRLRERRACTRYVRAGRAVLASRPAGAVRLRLRAPRRAGRHRLVVVAVDKAGNRSAVTRVTFRARRAAVPRYSAQKASHSRRLPVDDRRRSN